MPCSFFLAFHAREHMVLSKIRRLFMTSLPLHLLLGLPPHCSPLP
uniref:Uncharacterized protein n=1 Tax=Arundo donax TaxID=35708 RepID=A0A0A8Y0U5_ARUDO